MVFYIVKKRSSLPFALKFPNFRPKIRVFSKKQKRSSALKFPKFRPKSGCSLKKKKKKRKGLPFHLLSNFRLSSKNQDVL